MYAPCLRLGWVAKTGETDRTGRIIVPGKENDRPPGIPAIGHGPGWGLTVDHVPPENPAMGDSRSFLREYDDL
jgi:hypothetical protein